jgi:hypothetical protein
MIIYKYYKVNSFIFILKNHCNVQIIEDYRNKMMLINARIKKIVNILK